jgi:hypothetical protein
VATTFEPAAFNSQGVEPNAADPSFRQIGAYMAPTTRRRPASEAARRAQRGISRNVAAIASGLNIGST